MQSLHRGNVNNNNNGMAELPGQVIGMQTHSQKFNIPGADDDFNGNVPRIIPLFVHIQCKSSSFLLLAGLNHNW